MERRQLLHIGFQETEHEISGADYKLSQCQSNASCPGDTLCCLGQAAELGEDKDTAQPPPEDVSVFLPSPGTGDFAPASLFTQVQGS